MADHLRTLLRVPRSAARIWYAYIYIYIYIYIHSRDWSSSLCCLVTYIHSRKCIVCNVAPFFPQHEQPVYRARKTTLPTVTEFVRVSFAVMAATGSYFLWARDGVCVRLCQTCAEYFPPTVSATSSRQSDADPNSKSLIRKQRCKCGTEPPYI